SDLELGALVGRQPSRPTGNVKKSLKNQGSSKDFAQKLLVQHAVERHWMIAAHAGGDAVLQLFEHDGGNAGNVEPARLRDRHPDGFHKLRVCADKAVVAAGDGGEVGGKKAA